MRVNTKVGEPPMYLYTKVGEPPHQSRCKSALGIDFHWSITDFGAEVQWRFLLWFSFAVLCTTYFSQS